MSLYVPVYTWLVVVEMNLVADVHTRNSLEVFGWIPGVAILVVRQGSQTCAGACCTSWGAHIRLAGEDTYEVTRDQACLEVTLLEELL